MYCENVSFSYFVDGLGLLGFIVTFIFHVTVCLNGSGVEISPDKNNEHIGEQTQLLERELTC